MTARLFCPSYEPYSSTHNEPTTWTLTVRSSVPFRGTGVTVDGSETVRRQSSILGGRGGAAGALRDRGHRRHGEGDARHGHRTRAWIRLRRDGHGQRCPVGDRQAAQLRVRRTQPDRERSPTAP